MFIGHFAVAFAAKRTTQPRDRIGRWALNGFLVFLVLIYVANFMGPPPPSADAAAWTALSMWLLVAWSYWIDAHRSSGNGLIAPPVA